MAPLQKAKSSWFMEAAISQHPTLEQQILALSGYVHGMADAAPPDSVAMTVVVENRSYEVLDNGYSFEDQIVRFRIRKRGQASFFIVALQGNEEGELVFLAPTSEEGVAFLRFLMEEGEWHLS